MKRAAVLVLILTLSGATQVSAQGAPATPPATRPAAPATAPAPTKAASGSPQRLDGIAAVVNDEVVLQSDVEEQLYLYLSRAQSDVDSATVDTLRGQILDQIINEKLILGEAKRQGLAIPDAEVTRQAQDMLRDTKQRFGASYQEQLRKENMTEEKLLERYRDDARRQLLVQRLVAKQVTRRTPTQTEAEAYFKAHHDKFPKAPAEVRLSVIQIPATADSASNAQAKAKIEGIRKRIVAGEKFAKVAAEVSDDETSARAGGDLGYVVRGTMDPAFETAVFTRKLNAMGEPVRSVYGWHLIETLDRDTLKTRAGRDSLGGDGKPLLEAHVRHILVRVPLDDEDVERARTLAAKARAEVLAGKDFGAVAKRYSQYGGPHGEDGDIGFLALTTLQPSIRAGIDSLRVGGVSEVLTNQAGFNVFKVTERKAEHEYELDEVKDELPSAVADLMFREKLDEWVKTLRAKAQIKINKS